MTSNLFETILPGGKAFSKARDFINQNPTLTEGQYLRLFLKKYGKDIKGMACAYLLASMFQSLENARADTFTYRG